ncbi:MAG: VOC family protein [Thermomicrobiales bacterium]
MAHTRTYLNFARNTEAAFDFYRSVFGTDYLTPVSRFSDAPPHDGMPALSPEDAGLILNVQLPILGGHILMGTDAPESMGFTIVQGNNVHISIHPDTRAEADRLFAALSEGGAVTMPLQDMFWGDYFGSITDRFGMNWMVNCASAT